MGKNNFLLSAIATLSMAIAPAIAGAEEIQAGQGYMSTCKHDGLDWHFRNAEAAHNLTGDSETIEKKWYEGEIDSKESHWIMDYDNGTLNLVWYNEIMVCGHPGYNFEFTIVNDDTIKITREHRDPYGPSADCLCVYDTFATFSGIAPGDYHLEIYTRYPGDEWSETKEWLEMAVDIKLDDGLKSIYNANTVGIQLPVTRVDDIIDLSPDGKLRVNCDSDCRLEIFGANGEKIASMTCRPGSDCSIASLPKGIYVAKATADGISHSRKFIR